MVENENTVKICLLQNKEGILMSTTVTEQHSLIGNQESKQFSATTHPDAQWFLKGGNFGMFIHFGLSSVNGNVDLSCR